MFFNENLDLRGLISYSVINFEAERFPLGPICTALDCVNFAVRSCHLLRHLGITFPSITGCDAKAKKRSRDLCYAVLLHGFPTVIVHSKLY